jgi:hypothetical protein
MHPHPRDMTSPRHHGWWLVLRLAAIAAAAFTLVAVSVSVAPASVTSSRTDTTTAAAAATKCTAKIQKGKKLVDVYERYYKYAFKKIKGTKKYRKVIVRARRKMQVQCARQCVRTKTKKGKRYPVYKTVKKKVTVRKGNRLVKVKKKVRVYVFQKCPNLSGQNSSGTPVKVTLLKDSTALLDFGAFQRQMPLSGTLQGFIPGGYKLSQDNQIQFTRANIGLGQTDVFIDGAVVSAAIRTGNPTTATLDPTKQSTSIVQASGTVTAVVNTSIRLPLELRNDDDGCDKPYITTGYTEFAKTFFLKGKIEKGSGLAKLKLTSAPDPLDVEACLSPGPPTSPCNNSIFTVPIPVIVSLTTIVNVQIG